MKSYKLDYHLFYQLYYGIKLDLICSKVILKQRFRSLSIKKTLLEREAFSLNPQACESNFSITLATL